MNASALARVNLSVVTYCRNDAELVRGLLDSLEGWSVAPREVLVVDDASDEPFPDPPAGGRVRVLRHAVNRGAAQAHVTGLHAAACRYLLSIDCDIRLPNDWVRQALAWVEKPGTGLVSSRLRHTGSSELTNRYFDLLYASGPAEGPVSFVQGGVFLMKKSVFDAVGGYGGHQDRTGEDTRLCEALTARGYTLSLMGGTHAQEVRRISRTTAVRRKFWWQCHQYLAAIRRGEPVDKALYVYQAACLARLDALRAIDGRLVYYELLHALYGAWSLASAYEEAFAARLLSELLELLEAWPGLHGLLRADLLALGAQPSGREERPLGLATVEALRGLLPGLGLADLEEACARGLLAEDIGRTHHSLYDTIA